MVDEMCKQEIAKKGTAEKKKKRQKRKRKPVLLGKLSMSKYVEGEGVVGQLTHLRRTVDWLVVDGGQGVGQAKLFLSLIL